jgi:CubicO group peptidase (beta-lactamase class C family)
MLHELKRLLASFGRTRTLPNPIQTGLAVITVALLVAQFIVAKSIQGDTLGRVDAIVAREMLDGKIPAMSVAIGLNGEIQYEKAFGKADIENDIVATPQTLFRTGSVAKAMTSIAAMRLVEQGKLDLDAPIQNYCPAFPRKNWTITSRELLSHLSGIRHYSDHEIENAHHYASLSDAFVIFANDPLLFEPGTKFGYTTYGYTVLGCVLEGVTKESFPELMQQSVFAPAHMKNTFVDDIFTILPHRARGYSKRDQAVINAGPMDSSYKIPGGGFVSTAEDLVNLGDALLAGTIIKPSTVKLMWTAQKLRDGKEADWGLGWQVTRFDGQGIATHEGGQQGAACNITIYPDRKLVIVIMTNQDEAEPVQIDRKISAVLLKDYFGVEAPSRDPARER